MKIKQTSKKIVEQRKEIQVIRIEETIDELGNVIPAHDEEVEVIINITDDVTEEVEVKDLPQEELHHEPTQLDVIEAQVMFTALMTDTLLEV